MSGQLGSSCTITVGGTSELGDIQDANWDDAIEQIEDTTRSDGGVKSFIAGQRTWGASFKIIKKNPLEAAITALRTAYIAKEAIALKMVDADGDGWSGNVVVVQWNESQPLNGVVSIDAKVAGRGTPTPESGSGS